MLWRLRRTNHLSGPSLKAIGSTKEEENSRLHFSSSTDISPSLDNADNQSRGRWPDEAVFRAEQQDCIITREEAYCLLRICEKSKNLDYGKRIRSLIIVNALDSISVLGDHLIRMFAFHEHLYEANQAFEKIAKPSTYTWSAIVLANANIGQGRSALDLFYRMQLSGVVGDKYVDAAILKACTLTKAVMEGRVIHYLLIESGLLLDVVVGNTIIDMYAKCGCLEEAFKVFTVLLKKDVATYNVLIAGYSQHGEYYLATKCYDKMQQSDVSPNEVTFSSILKACIGLDTIHNGRVVHDQIIEARFELDVILRNSLLDMYAKCGSLEEAVRVFEGPSDRNMISWNTMISGYVQHGEGFLALKCLQEMQAEGLKPNEVTYSSALAACSIIGTLEQGRIIHEQVIEDLLQSDLVACNTLIDMYAKCGSLGEACQIFNTLPNRNVISWNTMIGGYNQNGKGSLAVECFEMMQEEGIKPNIISWGGAIAGYAQEEEGIWALECYEKMQAEGIVPNLVIFLCVLKACSVVGALGQGRTIHENIMQSGLQTDVVMGCTIADMYAKCGNLEEACKVFNKLPKRNLVSWNAMIAGYAQSAEGLFALQCFEKMQREGIHPDEVSFTSVLIASSRSGLLDEGRWYFICMRDYCWIRSSSSHCACMVDLLSRAGCLLEAEDLLQCSIQTNVMGWMSLLSACGLHGDIELGKRCFCQIRHYDSCAVGCTW